MKEKELVSVIIPAFNAGEFVKYAILSCCAQSYRPMEVVVVNDGSTDSTSQNVRSLVEAARNRQIQLNLIDLEENKGAANALNIGFLNARGSCVCWLSADDMFTDRRKIERQLLHLVKTGSFWSYYDGCFVGTNPSESRLVRGSYLPRMQFLNSAFTTNPDLRLMALLFRNPIHGSSVMIRKDRMGFFGQFDPITRNVDPDSDLWMRYTALKLKLAAIRGAPVFYRDHPFQTSKKKRLMMYGSELTRIRVLEVLRKKGVLSYLIKQFIPYFPIMFITRQQYRRPFVSEFLFDYVSMHAKEFDRVFVNYFKKSLSMVGSHPNYLLLDKSEFSKSLTLFRESGEFKKFEKIFLGHPA